MDFRNFFMRFAVKRLENIWLFKKLYPFISALIQSISKDRVGVYTAHASFFIILSIFPFALLVLNLLAHTAFDESYVIYLINTYIPHSMNPILIQIVNELYENVSGTLVSITAIMTVWTASKGVLSVMYGIYEIFNLHRGQNYLIARFVSMLYTVVFLLITVISLTLLVFGNRLLKLFISYIPWLGDVSLVLNIIRFSFAFLLLTFLFTLIYRFTNFKWSTIRTTLPGAVLCSIGWMIFSFVFSIYVDNFSNMSYIYGSFTGLIVFMLWIYFCIYIFFIGAEINKYYYPEIEYRPENTTAK